MLSGKGSWATLGPMLGKGAGGMPPVERSSRSTLGQLDTWKGYSGLLWATLWWMCGRATLDVAGPLKSQVLEIQPQSPTGEKLAQPLLCTTSRGRRWGSDLAHHIQD